MSVVIPKDRSTDLLAAVPLLSAAEALTCYTYITFYGNSKITGGGYEITEQYNDFQRRHAEQRTGRMDEQASHGVLRQKKQDHIRGRFPEGVSAAGEDTAEKVRSPAAGSEDCERCLGHGQAD